MVLLHRFLVAQKPLIVVSKGVKHIVVLLVEIEEASLIGEALVQMQVGVQEVGPFVELFKLIDANVVFVQKLGHGVDLRVGCRYL